MRNFLALCTGRPISMLMVVLAVLGGGIFSFAYIPLQKLPTVNQARVLVQTQYYGMSAADVRSALTITLEDALSVLEGLEKISSLSREGSSIITLDFRGNIDSGRASVAVREAIDAVYPTLPDGIEKPNVLNGNTFNLSGKPHVIIAVEAKENSGEYFERNFTEYELRSRLRRISGVGRLILSGGKSAEVNIAIDSNRSIQRDISSGELAQIIMNETNEVPAGSAREGDLELIVVSNARPSDIGVLRNLVLPTSTGPLILNDIADINFITRKLTSLFFYNNRSCTALEVYLADGADPVKLSRDIKKVIQSSAKDFGDDIKLHLVYDDAPSIIAIIKDLSLSLIIGALGVALILFIFLKSICAGIFASVSILFSGAASFIVLFICGKSLNANSLMGIAVGIGIVSDTSVIVIDALKSNSENNILNGTLSIVSSSLGSLASTVVVFIPILFLPGPIGALFGETAISIITCATTGTLYALFILPSFYKASVNLKNNKPVIVKPKKTPYMKVLEFVNSRKPLVFSLTLLLCAAGIYLIFFQGISLITKQQQNEVELVIHFDSGTRLEAINIAGIELISRIAECKNIKNVYAVSGLEKENISKKADPDYRKEDLIFYITYKDNAVDNSEVMRLVNKHNYEIKQPVPAARKLLGLNNGELFFIEAGSIEAITADTEALTDILDEENISYTLENNSKRNLLKISPKREVLALLNITAADIASSLSNIWEGLIAGKLEYEGIAYPIHVIGKNENTNSDAKKNIGKTIITRKNKTPVYVETAAEINSQQNKETLFRRDRKDIQVFSLQADNGIIPDLKTKQNIVIHKNEESSLLRYKNTLLLSAVIILVLLYLTMGFQFESFSLPLIFMLTIPLALSGIGPVFFLLKLKLDLGAFMGIIILSGIVVNNAIILFEATMYEKGSGGTSCDAGTASIRGARKRARSVIITTLTTCFVMIPVAISPQMSLQKSIAITMLSGTLVSALLTLFVVPSVLEIFLRNKYAKKVIH